MTHVTCRLTAKNRDQLRNPTLGNRVWATFTFLGTVVTMAQGLGAHSANHGCGGQGYLCACANGTTHNHDLPS